MDVSSIKPSFSCETSFKIHTPINQKQKRFNRTLVKVDNVFPELVLNKALAAIPEHRTVPNRVRNNRNITRVSLGELPDTVRFDDKCKLVDKNDFEWSLKYANQSLKDVSFTGAEAMAKIVGFKNMNVKLSIQILRYKLDEENPVVDSLPWHQDQNTLTMTVLISPYKQKMGSFNGGDLNFAEHDIAWMWGIYEDTIETFSYPYNGGFIFDNIVSEHKVSDIHREWGSCERILFTVFASPSEDFVRNLPSNLRVDIKDLPTVSKGCRDQNEKRADSCKPITGRKRRLAPSESAGSDGEPALKRMPHGKDSLMSTLRPSNMRSSMGT